MPAHTDRGIVALIKNQDGTTTVAVCAAVENGRPVNVYAKYVGISDVRVDSSVHLKQAASLRYTDRVVEVAAVPDGVLVRTPKRSLAL
jgi:hypothetical protein